MIGTNTDILQGVRGGECYPRFTALCAAGNLSDFKGNAVSNLNSKIFGDRVKNEDFVTTRLKGDTPYM